MSVAPRPSNTLRKLVPWLSAVLWTGVLGTIYLLAQTDHDHMKVAIAVAEARAIHQNNASYLFWNAENGLLYTPERKPQGAEAEIMHGAEEELATKDGRRLSLVHPAFIARMVHEQERRKLGRQMHLSSLSPMHPQNQAKDWDALALRKLEQGGEETYELVKVDGVPLLRYMGAIPLAQSCHSCHGEGRRAPQSLAGGLSVTIPFDDSISSLIKTHMMRVNAVYGSVWLLGLACLGLGSHLLGRLEEKRRATFEELGRNEQRFRFFFKNSPAAYLVLDSRNAISSANDACARLTGYEPGELPGKGLPDLVAAPEQARLVSFQERLRNQGFVTGEDIALQRRDGSVVLCSLAARLELGSQQDARVHCVLRDVTEQRRIQGALRDSEARYKLIANNTGDVTWLLDLSSDLIEYASPSCQRVLGIPPEQIAGHPLGAVLAPESADWLREGLPARIEAIREGDSSQLVQTHQLFFKSAQGRPLPMEVVSTVMLDEQGVATHMVGLCRDISSRLQYERALNALLIGTAYSTGEEFSQALVRELASVLGLHHVLLARLRHNGQPRLQTLACWAGVDYNQSLSYELSGSAALKVIEKGIQCHWDEARKEFPDDQLLSQLGIRSFLGVPLLGKDTETLGVLIAMDQSPVNESPALLSLLTLFAARASTEIERSDAIEALAERERRFRAIVEMGQAGYMRLDARGCFEDVNEAWLELYGYGGKEEILGRHYTTTLAPQDVEEGRRLYEQILSGVRVPSGEFSRLRKDGGIAFHTFSLSPLIQDGQVVGAEGFLIDTTRLRKAQSDAAMLFNEMIDAFALCEIICDSEGRGTDYGYLAVNPAFERITGLSAERVIGRRATEVMPGVEPHWIERYAMVALTGRPIMFEDYSVSLGRWFSVSAFQPSQGQFAIVFIDVSDRRNTELKLEYDEAELAAIHEHVPMMLVLLDSDRKVRRYNRAASEFAELTGLDSNGSSPGFFLGCFNAIQGGSDCGQGAHCGHCPLRLAITDTLENGRAHQREEVSMMLLRGDKLEECILKFSTAKVCVGSQSMVLLCMEDISPVKEAEMHMRRQAALLDITRDAICVLGTTSTIEYWSRGAERIFGWSSQEAVRSDWETLICKRENPEFREAIQTIRDNGEWMGELRGFSRKGERLVLQGRGTLVTEETGTPGSVLLVCTDITEARKLEQQFLRMQRMDNLGSLTSGIAHDLNNILSPILMSADLLPPLLTGEEHQPLLQMLRDSAKRGAEIVQQLLVFTRGNDIPKTRLEVSKLLKEMGTIIKQTFPRNVRLAVGCPDNLWDIQGDNTQVHQVLLNLCVNARDAMPEGGRLSLTAENASLDSTAVSTLHPDAKPGPYVVIQVADTGQGIPPEVIEKIFDPFFTTKAPGKGTGLGLSTVLAIVKSHGGFTLVNSRVGLGTEFRVFLPGLNAGEAEKADGELLKDLRGAGQTVLMVDDESSVRELMQLSLSTHNYQVILAADGAQCLELYAKHKDKISAVFVDMMMPHLDGRLTIECLRQMTPGLPIIAMSGMHEQQELVGKMGDIKVPFMLKPFTIKKMLAMLRDALEHKDVQ